MADYCVHCGNTRKQIDSDEPCPHCFVDRFSEDYVESSCLDIPEQYRSVMFDTNLVNDDVGSYYRTYLEELLRDITSTKLRNKNIFIGSPTQHSKKIWAFACIQKLFRRNVAIYPLFDLLEIKRIMQDLDRSKEPRYLEGSSIEPVAIYQVPYLFVVVPQDLSYDVYDTMSTLKDRRVRRGGSTIFLYSGSWKFFIENDKKGHIRNSVGDGSFGTIENKSFWVTKGGE